MHSGGIVEHFLSQYCLLYANKALNGDLDGVK